MGLSEGPTKSPDRDLKTLCLKYLDKVPSSGDDRGRGNHTAETVTGDVLVRGRERWIRDGTRSGNRRQNPDVTSRARPMISSPSPTPVLREWSSQTSTTRRGSGSN